MAVPSLNTSHPRFHIPHILQRIELDSVRWVSSSRGEMIAVAAQQFVRIYDLDIEAKPSVFEFVLPLGDVTELAFCTFVSVLLFSHERTDKSVCLIVLSSEGHLYVEELEKARCVEEASYYLTVTIALPTASSAVSMHYSCETRILFVSLEGMLLL
ncbi:unnamed protein product [Gongylonema pulchrum]|uniref:Nucleoporin_N domain-containing protein n=1 Tax=Gongylonema pulchrum TaxID=637853 RepID=A0A183ENQ9_9BILA|nr:unnamed protein product [Gongylonema pulchrum]